MGEWGTDLGGICCHRERWRVLRMNLDLPHVPLRMSASEHTERESESVSAECDSVDTLMSSREGSMI